MRSYSYSKCQLVYKIILKDWKGIKKVQKTKVCTNHDNNGQLMRQKEKETDNPWGQTGYMWSFC